MVCVFAGIILLAFGCSSSDDGINNDPGPDDIRGDDGSGGTAGSGGSVGTGGTTGSILDAAACDADPLRCVLVSPDTWFGFPAPGVVVCFQVSANDYALVSVDEPGDDCNLGAGPGLFAYAVYDGPLTSEPACTFEFPSDSPSAPARLTVTGREPPERLRPDLELGWAGTNPLVTLDLYEDDFLSLEMDFGERAPFTAVDRGTVFAASGPLNNCMLPDSAADGFPMWPIRPYGARPYYEELPEWLRTASETITITDQPEWLLRFLQGITDENRP